ncbi:MAG TPA: TRAP transporter substrate-binding protein [Rhodothermales bacterium]|nr:TRAP transporter substrate-binding protein [Rhodothermales bacterium]
MERRGYTLRGNLTRVSGMAPRVISLLCLAAIGSCRPADQVTRIKLGHGLDRTHPVHVAMEFMAERLAEKSGGTMQITIYPSQQLGTERESVELLQIGSMGMTKVSSSVLEGFAPDYQVFGLPYLFLDEEHRFNVLDGPIGEDILRSAVDFNVRGLTYYDAGTRSFYTKDRPILSPGDLSGLKIRTQESPVAIRMVRALGGSATPIAWGELYTALQQGIVDGAENNPPSFHTSRHYEVCKYYALDEHTAVPDVLLISTIVWDELTDQQRAWLKAAASESAVFQRQLWKEAVDEALKAVEAAGVQITRPEKEPFVATVQPLYEEFRSEPVISGYVERIRAAKDSNPPAPDELPVTVSDAPNPAGE